MTVMMALSLLVFLGFASLAVDMGLLYVMRTELAAAADAAALAAAQEIPDEDAAIAAAQEYATANEDATVLVEEDVTLGQWDFEAGVFTADAEPFNAVHVRVRRSEENDNPVGTWFAKALSITEADVEAEAVAVREEGGGDSRFLIDSEMIDSDEPAIEALANRLGKKPEDIISDLDDDWFIDLPAGEVLELPTGQIGDEGLFDMNQPSFPFTTTSDPSLENFLNYNEDSNSWRYDEVPKEMLDPLIGVQRVDDGDEYPSYVTSGCQVSPVYKSDVSALNDVNGQPAVNALGLRRGLLAFKILRVGADPDGSGSKLPNLVIEVCAPVVDLSDIGGGAATIKLVL